MKEITLSGILEFSHSLEDGTIKLLPKASYSVRYTPEKPVIGFAYEVQSGVHSFASDVVRPYYSVPNSLAFTPSGCDVFSESSTGGEYLVLQLNEAVDYRQFNDFVDMQAISSAQTIRRYFLSQLYDIIEMEVEVVQLQTCLQGVIDGKSKMPKSARSISLRRLKAVHEKIEDEIDHSLCLKDLSDVVGLSKSFFVRAFKAAVGKQPHHYLMERRVAKARDLLKDKKSKLADVAMTSGFCSQAHMTTAFKKQIGVTPKQYKILVS